MQYEIKYINLKNGKTETKILNSKQLAQFYTVENLSNINIISVREVKPL